MIIEWIIKAYKTPFNKDIDYWLNLILCFSNLIALFAALYDLKKSSQNNHAWQQALFAQEFDIRSFAANPTDLAARRYEQTTVNDEPAALIKIVTNIEGMIFDSNIGIVDVERREAEY